MSPTFALAAQLAVAATASVDRARPANDMTQNGPISPNTERRPVLPQTQRRFSSNDGIVPTPVAMTFAHAAGTALVATSTPSTVRLTVVAMTDTAPYRTS